MNNNEVLLMTSLEEQLKNDVTGQYQQKLLDMLSHQGRDIDRTLNRGCKPAEYQKLVAEKRAIESAELIVKQVARQLAG